MEKDLEKEIKKLLAEKMLKPSKYKGQNFLVNKKFIEEIADLIEVSPSETILEIGPGPGNLTDEILKRGSRIIAVEKDGNFVKVLKSKFKEKNNFKVVEGDILNFNQEELQQPYKVVGNIPYYITGPIIRKFLLTKNLPKSIVLTIQKEVAERIVATPPKSNFLSTTISFLGRASLKTIIKKENFWPEPKVDSAIIEIKPIKANRIKDKNNFINFLKKSFRQPRKTLLNNLLELESVDKSELEKELKLLDLSPRIRAHEIKKEDWLKIYNSLKFKKQP